MSTTTIAFIGGGNMTSSLVSGLCATQYPISQLRIAEPQADKRDALAQLFGVTTFADNSAAVRNADVIVLAVKPGKVQSVCTQLSHALSAHSLVISIAAGISLIQLASWLPDDQAIIRAMPNTPAQVLQGATGLCANANVSEQQRQSAEQLLQAVGITAWLADEQQLHLITALSGSGPGYYFAFMQAFSQAAIELGLDAATAHRFTTQTALGAAQQALNNDHQFARLREQVTSPHGTTEQGLNILQTKQIDQIIKETLVAAQQRSIELSQEN